MADKKQTDGLSETEQANADGNAAVQELLEKHAIKQGAYFEDKKESEQNKPTGLTALEVGWGRTEAKTDK